MTVADMNLIFVDVEAIGPSPITGVMTQFGAVHYPTLTKFHGVLHLSIPDPSNPAKPVLVEKVDGKPVSPVPAEPVMRVFAGWALSFGGRPIFISDNNGYDFMWIACKFDELGLSNPFGHSSRRISDFYAGLVGDFTKTQHWKKWRVTPHTHHPVDDAMGNVEAFAEMLRQHENGEL